MPVQRKKFLNVEEITDETKKSLAFAIEKMRTLFPAQAIDNEKINFIYEQLGAQHKTRFFVKVGEHCKSISTNEIACFYFMERCTLWHYQESAMIWVIH
jgi:hypothetical protein